jgi:Bacterial tandem repeat domain 1
VLYDAVLESGGTGQTRALGWAPTDFAKRFDAEQGSGRHLVGTDAVVISSGQVRHNGFWEPGGRDQTRAFGWTHDDFLTREDQERRTRRLRHLQSYNLDGTPGGIRYDGVWEPGSFAQSTALGWTFADIVARVQDELAHGNHVVHLQATNLDGTLAGMRYDAIFEAGRKEQRFAIGWERGHFNERNADEMKQGRRLVHLQSSDIGGGQYRYDAVWEPGNPLAQGVATGWALGDLLERAATEAALGRGITHLQAQPLPGDELRWDAIFAKISGSQRRLFGLAVDEMAEQLSASELTGRRLTHLRGYRTA